MKGKIIAILITVSMIFSMLPFGALAADFSDMPNDWSTEALMAAVSNGLLKGDPDGKIDPKGNVTRAQMAAVISRAFGTKALASLDGFSDVSADKWFYTDMQKAVAMKVILGDGGKLMPDNQITRQEVFAVLARGFKISSGEASDLAAFTDASQVASWALPSVAGLVKAGYVKGDGNLLEPGKTITRAEFAQILFNMVSAYVGASVTGTNFDGNVVIFNEGVRLANLTVKGDLIIGDGVGDGDVYLENVTINGRLIVRGGGANSIHIIGSSNASSIIITKTIDGAVRVVTEDGAEVSVIVVEEEGDEVIIEGTIGTVKIEAPDTKVVLQNATVNNVVVDAENTNIAAAETVTVSNISIAAENTLITTSATAVISNVNVAAENTVISGTGKVENANITANNTEIDTVGTHVNVASDVTGTVSNGENVSGGESGTTKGDGGIIPDGPGPDDGGNGGNGGGPEPYYPPVYTVTFNTTGGSTIEPVDVQDASPVVKPADPTKTGYEFAGWYTAATGGTLWDFTTAITADTTLYATWVSVVSTEAELRAAIKAGEPTIKLLNNITITKQASGTTDEVAGYLPIIGSVTIDGDGHSIIAGTNVARVFNIEGAASGYQLTASGSVITLKNLTVNNPNTMSNSRAVSFTSATDITLNLENCDLSAQYYCINIGVYNTGTVINAEDSDIAGWCAVQTWSPDVTATFDNCVLTGHNFTTNPASNTFATIVINADSEDQASDTAWTFNDCTITATTANTSVQHLFRIGAPADNTNITLNGSTLNPCGTASAVYMYSGALDTTFTVSNAAELKAALVAGTQNENVSVYLSDDINIGGAWTPIGSATTPFIGDFYGEDHTVSGFTVSASVNGPTGFFAVIKDGSVSDLSLNGSVAITNIGWAGILAGTIKNTVIDNCNTAGTISATGGPAQIAGIVEDVREGSTIQNSTNAATVSYTNSASWAYAGGIAGEVTGGSLISNCDNTGAVSISYGGTPAGDDSISVGGIAAVLREDSTIEDCTNTGAVTGNGTPYSFVGGIVGSTDDGHENTEISGCSNSGVVASSGAEYAAVGGIIGSIYVYSSDLTINSCSNTGNIVVSAADFYVGGIAGEVYSCEDGGIIYPQTITNCSVSGAITVTLSGTAQYSSAVGNIAGWVYDMTYLTFTGNTGTMTISAAAEVDVNTGGSGQIGVVAV